MSWPQRLPTPDVTGCDEQRYAELQPVEAARHLRHCPCGSWGETILRADAGFGELEEVVRHRFAMEPLYEYRPDVVYTLGNNIVRGGHSAHPREHWVDHILENGGLVDWKEHKETRMSR